MVALALVSGASLLLGGGSRAPGAAADVASGSRHTDYRDRLVLDLGPRGRVRAGDGGAAGLGDVARRVRTLPGFAAASVASPGASVGLGPDDSVLAECPGCVVGGLYSPLHGGRARIHAVGPDFFEAVGTPS